MKLLTIGLLLVFTGVFALNAWVVDDAYITFRCIENGFAGHGLGWNPGERVQAYTHPLWMLVLAAGRAVTSEYFYTSLLLSYALCIAAFAVAARALAGRTHPTARVLLLFGVLLGAKAVMDYTSSGLENPLAYLLMALFATRLLALEDSGAPPTPSDLRALFLLASLACLTRPDALLLYAPASTVMLVGALRRDARSALAAAAVGVLPLVAWTGFALLYYGFALPNTYYAKSLNAGVTPLEKAQRGLAYLRNSLGWDPLLWVAILGAAAVALPRRRTAPACLLLGVALHVAYVVASAASATHLSGRFFAVSGFLSAFVLVHQIRFPRAAGALAAIAALALLANPVSPLRSGTPAYRPRDEPHDAIDARHWVHAHQAPLLVPGTSLTPPNHEWFEDGAAVARSGSRLHLGGSLGGEAIGYFGFGAGPRVHVVDFAALADPLLARLPGCAGGPWKSGHFHRNLPAGYLASLLDGENRLEEPRHRDYYEALALITRGSLFGAERLRTIVAMNLGAYDALLEPDFSDPPDCQATRARIGRLARRINPPPLRHPAGLP